MPERDYEQEFRRELVNSSELLYVRKMKQFYDKTLQDLIKMIGEVTEFKVKVTPILLARVEERLSEFEKKEKKIIANYRKFARKVEGVTI